MADEPVPRISEVLGALPDVKYPRPPVDSDFRADCPSCGLRQRFNESSLDFSTDEAMYRCKKCSSPLVRVFRDSDGWSFEAFTGFMFERP